MKQRQALKNLRDRFPGKLCSTTMRHTVDSVGSVFKTAEVYVEFGSIGAGGYAMGVSNVGDWGRALDDLRAQLRSKKLPQSLQNNAGVGI